MSKKLLDYARLITRIGVNVQKGQIVLINSIIEAAPLTQLVTAECYKLGAKEVIVRYSDAKITKLKYLHESLDVLTDIPDYMVHYYSDAVIKHGACRIAIRGDSPEALKGVDSNKIKAVNVVTNKVLKPLSDVIMASKVQWVVACYPTKAWAKMVFPKLDEDIAVGKLLDAILKTVRIDGKKDPIILWNKHNDLLAKKREILNKYNFDYLHFQNKLGTNLKVKLIKNHLWGSGRHEGKINFTANLPTEEVWTMPDKFGVNGKVVASKPLSYQGNLIKDFKLTFTNGKVTKYSAKQNLPVLKNLLNIDKGSSYIGEVALVPIDSPINQLGVLFYSTLYDENASCHLALGAAYPTNIKNGTKMTRSQLNQLHVNDSLVHVDFMFGTNDMNVVGYTHDHKPIPIFKNGKYVI